MFHTDLHRFVTSLRVRLGPQLQNVPLLYQGVPELRDILALFDISVETPVESLETHELRARFESLVEGVFTVLAETRLFALFLDDLQDASDSCVFVPRSLGAAVDASILVQISRPHQGIDQLQESNSAYFASRDGERNIDAPRFS